MTLINTNGLSILGPGSEWFWAMAQFVLVAITLGGIYYQLRAQASANALQRMQFFVDQWESVAMSHDRMKTALHLKHVAVVDEMAPSMLAIAGFFETLGLLERRGHISRSEVFLLGRSVEMWWALLNPAIEAEIARQGANFYSEFRRLNGIIHAMDTKIGERYVLDESTIPDILDSVIRMNRADLMRARAIATGEIPAEPPATEAARAESANPIAPARDRQLD